MPIRPPVKRELYSLAEFASEETARHHQTVDSFRYSSTDQRRDLDLETRKRADFARRGEPIMEPPQEEQVPRYLVRIASDDPFRNLSSSSTDPSHRAAWRPEGPRPRPQGATSSLNPTGSLIWTAPQLRRDTATQGTKHNSNGAGESSASEQRRPRLQKPTERMPSPLGGESRRDYGDRMRMMGYKNELDITAAWYVTDARAPWG